MKVNKTPNKIRINNWKFANGEFTKLIWISDPFKLDNKWKTYAFFKSLINNVVKNQIIDWGTVSVLVLGRIYVDGYILNDKISLNKEYKNRFNNNIMDLYINPGTMKYMNKKIILKCEDNNYNINVNSFIFFSNNKEIHISTIEVIRSILAKNKCLLYSLLEPNSLEQYFDCSNYINEFHIKYIKKYPVYLLKNKKHILYLTWLLSDSTAIAAWNEVYSNLFINDQIIFRFPFNYPIHIKARCEISKDIIRVEQIMDYRKIKLDLKKIIINDLPNKNYDNVANIRRKNNVTNIANEIILNPDKGARSNNSFLKISLSNMEFDNDINIKYVVTNEDKKESIVLAEKLEFKEIKDELSMGDVLNNKNVNSLEVDESNVFIESNETDIVKMIMIFKELIYKYKVDIDYNIGELPKADKDIRARYLHDGVTVRKYIFANIKIESKNLYLLEVERENKSFATLAIYTKHYSDLNFDAYDIVNSLLISFINKNGAWDNTIIIHMGLNEKRIKHFSGTSISELGKKYYEKFRSIYTKSDYSYNF